MKEKPYKNKISISLDEDVIEKIKILAENDDRTLSAYINKVLKSHIQTNFIDNNADTES